MGISPFIHGSHIPHRLAVSVQFRKVDLVGVCFEGDTFCVYPCDNKPAIPGIYDLVKTGVGNATRQKGYQDK